jgi:hypothetical protein
MAKRSLPALPPVNESRSRQLESPRHLKITIPGIACFIVLCVAFFAWFGSPATVHAGSHLSRLVTSRGWRDCAFLFVAGAGIACFGEKEYGMFPPTSLRWLFMVFGVFIMGISTIWMHSLTKLWTRDSSAFVLPMVQVGERGKA